MFTQIFKKFLQNPKWHLATLKSVRFVYALPCGHPGPEGCCVPPQKSAMAPSHVTH